MKIHYLIISILVLIPTFGFGQGCVSGKIYSEDINMPLFYANAIVYSGDSIVAFAYTDTSGFFEICNLPLQKYVIKLFYIGQRQLDSIDLSLDSTIRLPDCFVTLKFVTTCITVTDPFPIYFRTGINVFFFRQNELGNCIQPNDVYTDLRALSSEFQIGL